MDNHELNRILQIIRKTENVNLSKIAASAGVDRSYLSKLVNMDGTKPAGKNILSKLGTAFPEYFQENNKSNTPQKQQDEKDKTIYNLSEAQILLAKAIFNLAEKINWGGAAGVSSDDLDEQKDIGEISLPLSGNTGRRRKRRDI